MIYSVVRYFVDKGQKILLVVPTTSLVEQMYKDFQDYGWDAENYCHRIYSGREKNPLWVNVTTENGIQYKFEGNETINLINNKKKLAKDLTETDEIDDRWLLSIK
jgi:reverse gyrase